MNLGRFDGSLAVCSTKKIFAEDSHRELSCAAAQMIVAWATFEAEAAKLSPARRTTQPVSAAISATATNGSCSLRKKKIRASATIFSTVIIVDRETYSRSA